MIRDKMKLEIEARSENEAFARMVVAAFVARLDPILTEINDIKTAVSEAVTNSIIHGYDGREGKIYIDVEIEDKTVFIEIRDCGVGIENIIRAREPMYTSKPNLERSGMGFTVMETFMDYIDVKSVFGAGTSVVMKKVISSGLD